MNEITIIFPYVPKQTVICARTYIYACVVLIFTCSSNSFGKPMSLSSQDNHMTKCNHIMNINYVNGNMDQRFIITPLEAGLIQNICDDRHAL